MHQQFSSETNLKTDSSDEKPQKLYSNKQSLIDLREFLQDKHILSPRLSSNISQQHNMSDVTSKGVQSHRGHNHISEFAPFTQERDALGRLLHKAQPGSSINSEYELNLKGSLSSRQGSSKNLIGSLKSFTQFQHSNNILQQVKLAVEQDALKRQKKKVNIVGQTSEDSLLKDVGDKSSNKATNLSVQFDKDSHFNINVSKRVLPLVKSHITLSSSNHDLNNIQSVEYFMKTPRGNVSKFLKSDQYGLAQTHQQQQLQQKQHQSHNSSTSPHKRMLIDQKRKASQPCLGLYNVWNKEQFTLKKTPNVILQDRNDELQQEKLRQQQEVERQEKKKAYRFFQKEKQREREKFVESFLPKQEIKIIFPKLKENNKYQVDEFKQLQNRVKLQMKELDEEANFPIHFQDKLNDLKVKAKRIREAIILWNDQNPYKMMKQREKNRMNQVGSSMQLESNINID